MLAVLLLAAALLAFPRQGVHCSCSLDHALTRLLAKSVGTAMPQNSIFLLRKVLNHKKHFDSHFFSAAPGLENEIPRAPENLRVCEACGNTARSS